MHHKGYSLLEMIVVVSIAAILLTLGVPAFDRLLANSRLRTEVNALFHAVHLARKESIMRRQPVTICPSSDGMSCNQENVWTSGWLIFANLDRDSPPSIDANEPVLSKHAISATIKINSNRQAYSLRSTQLRATNGTIKFCDPYDRAPSRALVISYTGRPRVSYKDSRKKSYDCND